MSTVASLLVQPDIPNINGATMAFSDPEIALTEGQNHDRVTDIVDSPMPDYVEDGNMDLPANHDEDAITIPQSTDPVPEPPKCEEAIKAVTTSNSVLFNHPFDDPTAVDDPAYSVTAVGSFEWKILNFSALRSSQNLEKVCLSDPVKIGDSSWQLKLYPNGFSSDFLGIYLQCSDFIAESDGKLNEASSELSVSDTNTEYIQPVLPLFGDHRIVKRRRVVAQFRITMFNVNDTRTHFTSNEIASDFSARNTDRGFSRFGPWRVEELKAPQPRGPHGPWSDWNGQAKATSPQKVDSRPMLENDTIAFHVQVRIIEDPTGHLWENQCHGDSYSTHGLRGLRCEGSTSLISAISSWLLLAPFRKIIYDVQVPDPSQRPIAKPMKLVKALQRILYRMRCAPGDGVTESVLLDSVKRAIQWHGDMLPDDDETDVFRVWYLLKRFLEIELRGTEHELALKRLLNGGTRCRIRDMNIKSIQAGVETLSLPRETPNVLHVELPRQYFDEACREWRIYDDSNLKIVEIDDNIQLNGAEYILYGVIGIDPKSRHNRFVPILRPDGKRWFTFAHEDGENRVKRLTEKDAIEQRRKKAYAAIYVRKDVASKLIEMDLPPKEDVPSMPSLEIMPDHGNMPATKLLEDNLRCGQTLPPFVDLDHGACQKCAAARSDLAHFVIKGESDWPIPEYIAGEKVPENSWSATPNSGGCSSSHTVTTNDEEFVVFTIFLSSCFKNHSGPGLVNIYDHEQAKQDGNVFEIEVRVAGFLRDIKQKALDHLGLDSPGLENQCRVWGLNSSQVSIACGELTDEDGDKVPVCDFLELAPGRCLWLHIEPSIQYPALVGHTTNDLTSSVQEDEVRPAQESTPSWISTNTMDTHPDQHTPDLAAGTCYILVKEFNHEKESLIGLGHVLMSPSVQIEKTVRSKVLNDDDTPLLFYIEEPPRRARRVDGKGTINSQSIFSSDILIVQRVPEEWLHQDEESLTIFLNSPSCHLAYWWDSKNFPEYFSTISQHVEENYFTMDGHYYSGQYARGVPHGFGRWINSDGDVYEGEFYRGYRLGKGRIVFRNGDIYTGEWLDDDMHGNGKMIVSSNGNTYEGSFKNGKRFGKGIAYLEKAEEEYASSGKQCGVCYANDADAFFGCKHICMCVTCANQCKNCPVCRHEIGRVLKLEFSCLR